MPAGRVALPSLRVPLGVGWPASLGGSWLCSPSYVVTRMRELLADLEAAAYVVIVYVHASMASIAVLDSAHIARRPER